MLTTKIAGSLIAGGRQGDQEMVQEPKVMVKVLRGTVAKSVGDLHIGKVVEVTESEFRELYALGKVAPVPASSGEGADLVLELADGIDLAADVATLGLTEGIVAKLKASGLNTVGDLEAFEDEFTAINGIGPEAAAKIDAALEVLNG